MNVAVFTDNDFGRVDSVTTTLRGVLRYAPPTIRPCVYAASEFDDEGPGYFAPRRRGTAVPFCGDLRVFLPRIRVYLDRARLDRIDLVHTTTPGPVGLAAIYVARRLQLPLLGSVHVDIAAATAILTGSRRVGDLIRRYLSWTYRRCDHLLVSSERGRQVVARSGIQPTNIGLWHHGVDTDLYSPAKRSLALRERWRVCERRPAIIYVGRLSADKGLGMLRSFQSALHRRRIEHRLVLVGDGPCRRALQDEMPDAVFPGVLSPAELAIALASADLFVLPDPNDIAGDGVLDAQASGVPVLVPRRSGAAEYISPGESGAVAAAGNAEAFADAAALILRDPDRQRCMGSAARAHALTQRWETTLAPLYDAYLKMAAVGRQRAGARRSVVDTSDSAVTQLQ